MYLSKNFTSNLCLLYEVLSKYSLCITLSPTFFKPFFKFFILLEWPKPTKEPFMLIKIIFDNYFRISYPHLIFILSVSDFGGIEQNPNSSFCLLSN